jgi:hypothetical protein
MVDAQGVVGSPSESGIGMTTNGESFRKYAQSLLAEEVNYRVLGTKEK